MGDFTVANLKQVESAAADRGPDVEARFGCRHDEIVELINDFWTE